MNRILTAAVLSLLSLPVFAAAEESAANAPAETVSTVYAVIFGIVFIGMIVGFFAYMMWGGKDDPEPKK